VIYGIADERLNRKREREKLNETVAKEEKCAGYGVKESDGVRKVGGRRLISSVHPQVNGRSTSILTLTLGCYVLHSLFLAPTCAIETPVVLADGGGD
jgi:hypothetical protein